MNIKEVEAKGKVILQDIWQKKLDDYNLSLYKPRPKSRKPAPKPGTQAWNDSCQGHIYFDWVDENWDGYGDISDKNMDGKYYKRLGDAINAARKMGKIDKYRTIEVTYQGGVPYKDKQSYYKCDKSKRDLVFLSNDPVDVETIEEWFED